MSNYTNDILLAVFFKQDADRSNALFVSFDGLTFYEIGVPYTHSGGANRDPALLYYNGVLWDLSMARESNVCKPKWGYSYNLQNWSSLSDAGVNFTANTYKPYDRYGYESNTNFDYVAPEPFTDGSDVWIVSSLGYVGEWHGQDAWHDVMRPYLIKVTTLTPHSNLSAPSVSYNDAIPIKVNQSAVTDERGTARIQQNQVVNPEDRIDGFIYKEGSTYYLVVKRFGTSNEIWSIGSLSNVSNPSSWTLVNSDFMFGYEGACLVKFRGKYLVYADKMRGYPSEDPNNYTGIHVTTCGTSWAYGMWKDPTRVTLKYKNGSQDATYDGRYIGRHGSVMVVSYGTTLFNQVMSRFDSKGYSYTPSSSIQPWQPDMNNGWFRSNGKRYLKNNGNLYTNCEYFDGSHWSWFDSDGSLARNKDVYIQSQDKWVHYDANGWMVYGDQYLGPQYYYYDTYPASDHHWYYFDPTTGKMAHGWITVNGQVRHYDEVTGWRIS